MIDKIENNLIREIQDKSILQQTGPQKTSMRDQVDASLDSHYASLLEEANQIPQQDDEAVRRAQELMASGQLDTPENIRRAAENLFSNGI